MLRRFFKVIELFTTKDSKAKKNSGFANKNRFDVADKSIVILRRNFFELLKELVQFDKLILNVYLIKIRGLVLDDS